MKVAIVHFDISLRTGAQRLILGLGKTLRDLGNEVVYFTAIYDKNTAFDEFSEYNIISSLYMQNLCQKRTQSFLFHQLNLLHGNGLS